MAAGEGEYANTFASLLGATDAAKPALLKMFQEKYSLLFPSAATTSVDMLGALTAQLEANPKLLG
jgi:hypothetical protein